MRKFLLLLILIPVFGFSIEYGISVDEGVGLSGLAEVSNTLKATIWSNINLGTSSKFELRGTVSHSTASQPEFPYFMDIDTFKFSSTIKKSSEELPDTTFSIGRYPVSDQTGLILAHKLDGLSLSFKYPLLSMYTSFYYSGLLWKNASGISPSTLDGFYAGKQDVYLGSPRFIGTTGFTLPPLFNQRLSLETLYQIDLREKANVIAEYTRFAAEGDAPVEGGGLLDTYYASAKLSGVLPLDINYKLSYIFNGGHTMSSAFVGKDYYSYSDIFGQLVEFKLDKYLTQLSSTIISYRFLYSSGDEDYQGYQEGNSIGQATNFVPLTRSGFGTSFSPSPGNIIVNELSYSLKPIDTLQTIVKASVFNRTTTGPISEDGIKSDSTDLYLGSELDVTLNYRPLSDLGVILSTGFYFPSAGAYDPTYLETNSIISTIRLNVSFSI